MDQLNTYRITITRQGHQPHTHIKEFVDIFVATEWAKNYWPDSPVSVQVQQVRLLDLGEQLRPAQEGRV